MKSFRFARFCSLLWTYQGVEFLHESLVGVDVDFTVITLMVKHVLWSTSPPGLLAGYARGVFHRVPRDVGFAYSDGSEVAEGKVRIYFYLSSATTCRLHEEITIVRTKLDDFSCAFHVNDKAHRGYSFFCFFCFFCSLLSVSQQPIFYPPCRFLDEVPSRLCFYVANLVP